MREVVADLWSFLGKAEHVCVTTNSIVNSKGLAVMGRGCALEAAQRWPEVRRVLASQIRQWGNTPHALGVLRRRGEPLWNFGSLGLGWLLDTLTLDGGSILWSFPVKHHWRERADLDLIRASARRLRRAIDAFHRDAKLVVIPRPGCGNGGLEWIEVAAAIAGILDDRFVVVDRP
jgi:hypothetical protein